MLCKIRPRRKYTKRNTNILIGTMGLILTILLSQPLFAEQKLHDEHDSHAAHKKMMQADEKYKRTINNYIIPDIQLINMRNEKVSLKDELNTDEPIMVNFIFTTCTTICPIMAATFSEIQRLLGKESKTVKMVSISIDPEQDTPKKLRAFAKKFNAGDKWHFLTGKLENIVESLKALDAYRGNKMNHVPVTLLRASANSGWVRIEGLTSAKDLVSEYRKL